MHRIFLTLQDAFKAIRELQDFQTLFTTKNLDFHGRKIKNASPSEDDYDYVVRKELKQSIGDTLIQKKSQGVARDQLVWLEIELPGARSIGTDITLTRIRIAIDISYKLVLTRSLLTVKTTPPSGGPYVLNILRSNDASVSFQTIFAGADDADRLQVIASAHRGEQDTFGIKEFFNDDELRVDEIKTNGAVGMHATIFFKLMKR